MRQLLRQSRRLLTPVTLLCVIGLVMAMRPAPSALERVQTRGELVVATRPSLTTVYNAPDGPTGMEYQLAKGFADRLGVKLRLLPLDSLAAVKYAVRHGQADFAAAGLMAIAPSSEPSLEEPLRFTTPYQKVDTLVLYRLGTRQPQGIDDLIGRKVVVRAGSRHEQMLIQAQLAQPQLRFTPIVHGSAEAMLNLVDQGKADYALINSNAYAIHRGLFPNVAAAFALSKQQGLAWAFAPQQDRSLYLAAQRYLLRAKASGQTARLAERFYGHQDNFDLYAARSFVSHLQDRLPQYRDDFHTAAAASGFDWRLLAAVAYQESLWNADAVSPTGVEGLMMLTASTAQAMGISDRTDPAQSIEAGAAYLRRLHDRLPQRIAEPDRTWMALAAYNVGLGHLEDARVLTQSQGADPDSWAAVQQRLPLLSDARYATSLRHGPAPGGQASVYVSNIQRYYDLLIWADNARHHGQTLLAAAE